MSKKLEPNAMQAEFIYAPADSAIRVLAPAGSGKTWANELRILYLLENNAKPRDILYVVFNKSMAQSGLERILKTNPSLKGTEAEKQICTIHAICYRLLMWSGDKRRVVKSWKIKRTLQDLAEELWEDSKSRPGWKEIYDWICRVKALECSEEQFPILFDDALGAYHGERLTKASIAFGRELRKSNELTFPDMIRDVEQKLINDPNFRKEYQERFKWILVDEAQDVNGQVMRILTTLAKPQNQLMLTGDTDQLAYRFIGATPEMNLYDGFEQKYPNGLLVKMNINYRSTQTIIDKCKESIRNNYQANGGPYKDKYFKDVQPRDNAPVGDPVTFIEYDTPEDEARNVVDDIALKIEQGNEPDEFLVASRTKAQLGYLEGHFVRMGIPYINITGGSFWLLKHIQDAIAYIKVATDEKNKDAFKRIFNIASKWMTVPWKKSDKYGQYCHHRYLGRQFLDACSESYQHIWKALNSENGWRYKAGINNLTQFIGDIQMELEVGDVAHALQYVIDNSITPWLKADEGLPATDESDNGKLEDFKTLLDLSYQFDSVNDFLNHVEKMEQATKDMKNKDWSGKVLLSSIHRAKGLEKTYVYGIGISEGVIINQKTQKESPVGLLPHTFSLIAPPQMGVLPSGGKGRVTDERCLFFILVSRAKEECHLSSVRKYRKADMFPSRFISEIGLSNKKQQDVAI